MTSSSDTGSALYPETRVFGVEKLNGKFKATVVQGKRAVSRGRTGGTSPPASRLKRSFLHGLSDFEYDPIRQPIPVCLTHKDLKGELERAI